MTETQKDLTMLLTKYIARDDTIKGIVLFLQKEEQQMTMIHYLIKNKEKSLTEEQILSKAEKIIKEVR